MNPKLKELKERRHAKAREARAVLDKAESESRELTAEDRTSFDALDTEITELDAQISVHERAARHGDAPTPDADDDERSEFGTEDAEQRAQWAREDRERIEAFRAQHGRAPGGDELAGLGLHGERALEASLNEYRKAAFGGTVQDTDEVRRAWFNYMTVRGNVAEQLPGAEFRVLSQATNPAGGYLVPTTFETTLIEKSRDFGVMRQIATVMTTQTGEKIQQPAEDTHGTAAWLAINAAYPETDEAFVQVTLDAFKAGTLMRVAEELLQDAAFDLEGYIARQYAARIGILENTAYVVGDGIGKPTGVVTSSAVGATLPVGNTVGFTTNGGRDAADSLITLYHSVIQAYRNRGSWLMKDATVIGLRKVKDVNGQYLWQPGLQADKPDTLLGRPLFTDPDMPTMAANAKSVLFGDFSYYTIRDVQGVGIQRLNELYAANGQVGFRGYHRTEGKLVNTDAIKALANSAT